jgi:hypothetical protein
MRPLTRPTSEFQLTWSPDLNNLAMALLPGHPSVKVQGSLCVIGFADNLPDDLLRGQPDRDGGGAKLVYDKYFNSLHQLNTVTWRDAA